MSLGWPQLVVALVALQRLLELVHARRNTQTLRARGGVEHGARHYPLFVLLHAGWLLALFLLTPAGAPVHWPLVGLLVLLQAARFWVLHALGPYWTTRVITLAHVPLVRRGPYRWLRHPNYVIVTLEIALLPLAFGQWQIALVFSVLNGLLLAHRLRVENAALAGRRPPNS